jgi:hypothetical protein
MKYRKRVLVPLLTLLGAAVLLAGCGQAALLPTPTPSDSNGAPAEGPTGTPPPAPPTAMPTETAASPSAPAAASPTLAVIVGTSLPSSGSVLSPPLRDITPVGPPTPGPPMTPDAGGTVTVGMDDNGRSVELRVGDTLQLALPSSYDWSVTLTNTAILSPVGAVAGGQSQYKAAQAGTTALLAGGDPPCRKAQPPCEMPSRFVQVNVIVR